MPEETEHRGTPADPRTNTVVKVVLRVGLTASLLLLLAGLVAQLATARHVAVDVRMFHVFGAPSLGEALMGLGVLILTLTPVAGILSVLGNWLLRERDRGFSAVAAIVLVVLAAAVIVGFLG